MGTVWVARHLTQGNDVAIKFMHGDPTELTVARGRFEREARATSLIRHPNVVTVQDYGIEGQTPYMAMELLRGENLDDFLVRKQRVPLTELEPIISQISRGLRKAHETGIVHRDLKHSNVFLARDDDGREIVKILDFGIAKEIDTTLGQHTKTTELMGSPHYMSPEQLRSTKKSDFRSDLWSLGVIIYKAITGVTPFPGDTLAEVMVQVFSGKFTPASALIPGLPPTIDAFFQRAFARKPDERFQSIADMHNAFVAVVAGKPLPAPTAPAPAPAATATPVPFTTSSPSWPGVVVPPPRASAPSSVPVEDGYAPTEAETAKMPPRAAAEAAKVPAPFGPPPKVPTTFDAAKGPGAFAPTIPVPVAPSSNAGLSAPPENVLGAGMVLGFGASNPAPQAASTRQDNPAPIVALPEDPKTEPVAAPPPDPQANPTRLESTRLRDPNPVANDQRKRNLAIAIAAALVLLVIGLVIALGGSSASGDKPIASPENSGVPVVAARPSAEPSGDTSPAVAASGSALTPEEIATAVPDESPVVVDPNEPPAPAPSTTQAPKSTWKPIPKGQARLKVEAKGGVCKITINATYYGLTPVDALVDAGKIRVFCRTPTGATRSKELRAPENRTTKIEFEVKQ